MTTKNRRKYHFRSRMDAEHAYHSMHRDAIRNYFAAIHFQKPFRMESEVYEIGNHRAEIIRNHAKTGRELSIGPIVVIEDNSSGCSPQIGDAYDWAVRIVSQNVTPIDQDSHDLRELATKILVALKN